MFTNLIITLVVALLSGAGVFFFTGRKSGGVHVNPEEAFKKAAAEAEHLKAEAKAAIERMQKALDSEEKSMEETAQKMETLIAQKEEIVKRREERNKTQEEQVNALRKELNELQEKRKTLGEEKIRLLSERGKLSKEQALELSRTQLQELITHNADQRKSTAIDEFTEELPRHAKAILQVIIQRLGVPSSVDKNSTGVTIKDEKFKGLLIGKNGTNVLYLESLLPVSLIFNFGVPENLHVGGVNLLRRNIAKRAIEKLQNRVKKTGTLDHAMIKAAVDEADAEIMAICDKKGEEAMRLMGLDPKKVDKQMVNYVGRLYFRTSYGQNITGHSNEMGFAARMIAEQIGTEPEIAMQGAFFHDIGKAIDHDVGGAHDDLSKEILERFGYDPRIVHAAYVHHDKGPCESPEDFIVKAVDAISGGRPGARQESVSNYFERIQKLEEAVKSFDGVSKVFAMSAGRELRVIVENRIHDQDMKPLADGMASKIADTVAFPGVIKVNLIRITKSVDYAREKMGRNRSAA